MGLPEDGIPGTEWLRLLPSGDRGTERPCVELPSIEKALAALVLFLMEKIGRVGMRGDEGVATRDDAMPVPRVSEETDLGGEGDSEGRVTSCSRTGEDKGGEVDRKGREEWSGSDTED